MANTTHTHIKNNCKFKDDYRQKKKKKKKKNETKHTLRLVTFFFFCLFSTPNDNTYEKI